MNRACFADVEPALLNGLGLVTATHLLPRDAGYCRRGEDAELSTCSYPNHLA